MNHVSWLQSRTPAAPPPLVAHIRSLFASHGEWESLCRAEAFVEASQLLLRRVLMANPEARSSALDLLAADACVTYAFEAAADHPDTIAARATAAKEGIAGVAAGYVLAAHTSPPRRAV